MREFGGQENMGARRRKVDRRGIWKENKRKERVTRNRWNYKMERNGSVYPTGGKNGKEKCEVDDEEKMELCT
jgi:hypothetical protein